MACAYMQMSDALKYDDLCYWMEHAKIYIEPHNENCKTIQKRRTTTWFINTTIDETLIRTQQKRINNKTLPEPNFRNTITL